MLKRFVILTIILSTFVVLAMAPMNRGTVSENTQKLQVTVEVTAGVVVTDATPVPVAGGGGSMPMSTMIIFGLFLLLGVAIVVGGIALVSRRQETPT
jgi:hypothetical protein